MKNRGRKLLSAIVVVAMLLSILTAVFAGETPSGTFQVPAGHHRPAEEPEAPAEEPEEPAEEPEAPAEEPEEPAEEPEEPAEEPVEIPAEPVEVPVEVPVEEPAAPAEEPAAPAEEPAFPAYDYELDADGNLVLDNNGNPIAVVDPDVEIPVEWLRDEEGNLVLDENGHPIVTRTIPAGSQIIITIPDKEYPDRSVDVYLSTPDNTIYFGQTATLISVIHGFEGCEVTYQWETSPDNVVWTHLSGETGDCLTIEVTRDNYMNYWRVGVTIVSVDESI